MSISGSIDLRINLVENSNIIDFLVAFENSGWIIDIFGKIQFLPLGDEDFDWQFIEYSNRELVESILIKKFDLNELIGISLIKKELSLYIDVLIYPKFEKISFLMYSRKTILDLDVTDFSWYLNEIIPIMIKSGFSIESIECCDA